MGKFNWWRRHRKHQPLKRKDALRGRSYLLQQIEHGDLELSDYYKQAQDELNQAEEVKNTITLSWNAGTTSLFYKLDEVDRKYRKRYHKLMEDYHEDELSKIHYLREALLKEFEVDVWNDTLDYVHHKTGDLISFYQCYKTLAKQPNPISLAKDIFL